MNEMALREAARRAYERGRLRRALASGAFVGTPVLLSIQTWGPRPFALWVGLFCYLAFAWATWRGQRAAMGAFVGLVAGSFPLILLALTRSAGGHACIGHACAQACMSVCFTGGVLGGGLLAWRAARGRQARAYWGAAGLVGGGTAALGCAPLGVGAAVGLAAGLSVTTIPILVWRRAMSPR